jgi:hypothetical protein
MSLKPKTCKTCLWRWKDLFGREAHRCYNGQSNHYHDETSEKQNCGCYERRAHLLDAMEQSRNRQR